MNSKVILVFSILFFLFSVAVSKILVDKKQGNLLEEGMELAKTAKYSEAIEKFEALLLSRPGTAEAESALLDAYVKQGNLSKADALAAKILEKDPQHLTALIVRGDARSTDEKWDEAQKFFEKAAAIKEDELGVLRGLAFIAIGKGENDKAQEWIDKAFKIKGDDARTLLGEAILLQAQGKNQEALKYMKKASAAAPDDPSIAAKLAGLYLAQGNAAEAQGIYKKMLETNPDSLDVRKGIAEMYESSGQFSQAAQEYKQILDKQPDDARTALKLARLYREAGQGKESLALLEDLQAKLPEDPAVQTGYARALAENGNADKALELLGKILEKDKNFLPAYLARGAAYAKKGNPDQGMDEIRQVLAIDPKYVDGYFELGKAYIDKGMHYEGIQELQKILEIDPRYPHIHYHIGLGFLNGGFADVAIEEFKAELQVNPGNPLALYNLALANAKAGRAEEAEAGYAKVLEVDPNNVDALYNLALTHAKAGKADQAAQEFEKILSIKPDDQPSAYNLGILYVKAGKDDKAISAFKKVAQLDPNNLDAHDNLAGLYERKGDMDSAIAEYQAILQVPGLEAGDVVWANLSGLYLKKKDIAKAREAAQKALEINPNSAQGFFSLGAVHEYNDAGEQFGAGFDAAKSVENYRKALELDSSLQDAALRLDVVSKKTTSAGPPVAAAQASSAAPVAAPAVDSVALQVKEFLTKGDIFFSQGRLDEAKTEWEQALRLDPGNASAQESLKKLETLRAEDQARKEAERAQKAKEEEEAKASKEKDAQLASLLSAGQAAFDAGNYDDAIAQWQEALKQDPQNAIAQANLASAQQMKSSREKETQISGLLQQGQASFDAGNYDDAIAKWEEIMKMDPGNAIAQMNLASAQQMKAAAEAQAAAPAVEPAPAADETPSQEQAAAPEISQRQQDASEAKIKDGISSGDLYAQVGDWPAAIQEYQKVLAIDPANTQAQEKLAEAQKALTEKENAAKKAEQEKLDKERKMAQSISALLTQGEVYFKDGAFDEAIDLWTQVLEISPNDPTAKAKIAQARDLKLARDQRKKKELEAKEFAKQRAMIRIKEAQLKQKKEAATAEGGAFRPAGAATAKAPKKKLHLAKKRDAFLDERFLDETLASITSDY